MAHVGAAGADTLIRVEQLRCGLRLVTEAMTDVRSVTVGYWVGTGSRDETPELAGASHFLEHLLFKGTATRTAREIAAQVDGVGGDMNAFTTKEYTSFYVHLLSEELDLGLDILSDIIWSPELRPDEIEAERRVITEEILMHHDEPVDAVHDLAYRCLFESHPLGRDVAGERETVVGMKREQIADYFAQHYRPMNIVVAAAGDLEHDRLAHAIEERFAGKPGGRRPERTAPAELSASSIVAARPTEQAHLILGFRAPNCHDERRWALAICNHVLGGGLSSRLFQEVRERRGLAYSIYSDWTAFQDSGALTVYAGTATEQVVEVVERASDELERLSREGITADELEVAKGYLRAELLMSLEDPSARMGRLGRSLLVHGEVMDVDELLARFAAVTIDDVSAIATEVLGAQRCLAAVGPLPEDLLDGVKVA